MLTYVIAGQVHVGYALLMAAGAALGGVGGARLGKHLPERIHRGIIVLVGLAMTAWMFSHTR